jgi:hypothetical protein
MAVRADHWELHWLERQRLSRHNKNVDQTSDETQTRAELIRRRRPEFRLRLAFRLTRQLQDGP